MVSTMDFWPTDRGFKSFPNVTWDKKWVLAFPNFRERTARKKLELTDSDMLGLTKMQIFTNFQFVQWKRSELYEKARR